MRFRNLSFFLLLVACSQVVEEEKSISSSQAQDGFPADDRPVIHFGVISRYNPVIMYKNYQPIMDYLSAHTSYRFELKLGKDYEDAVRFLREGAVEISSLGGVTYLEAHKEFDARPLVRPLNKEGESSYRSIFIVLEGSPLQTLADLRGHSLALASLHSTSGNLIPRYELARAGIHLQELKDFENLAHHESVAKAVLEGRFDAGAVKDVVAYSYQRKGLRFLHVSDPIPSVPLVIRRDLPDSIAEEIAEALLKVDAHNPEHQEWLREWDEEFRYGFVRASDSEYELLRERMNGIPEGCGKGCHPPIRF